MAATGIVAVAQPARAGTISVPFVCTTNYLGVDFDNGAVPYNVTITAPGGVNAGDPIVATYDFGQVPIGLPFPLTNVSVSNVGTVTGRLQTTGTPSVNATSTPSATVAVGSVPAYGTVAGTAVSVSLPSSAFIIGNKVELVPGTFSMTLVSSDQFGPNGATTTCAPQSTTAFAARTTITGQIPVNPVDRCVAYDGNYSSPGNPAPTSPNGCVTEQVVNVSITAGRLVQRAYVNTTPAGGPGVSDGSGISSPVPGTGIVNTNATTVNLGTLTSPLSPVPINARMNDITVTDTRGGTFGWTLSASLTDFDGSGSNAISRGQLAISPTCSPATSANAWDYDAVGQAAIPGFDASTIAPGASAGSASQTFASAVALCTKNTDENVTTGSSGGVYNITGPLLMTVPAFQAADKYTAVMTVLLV
jgi:hypothetical protein